MVAVGRRGYCGPVSEGQQSIPTGFRPVVVVGVRVEMPSNQPIVLLKVTGSAVHLPIWIGPNEASAIAMAQQGITPPRPLTHDLFVATLAALGRPLRQVRVTSLVSGVFHAELHFDGVSVSARPSDGVALALRADVPVLVAQPVLDEAGIEIADAAEDEVEKFREFLDNVSPEDFT